MEDKRSEQGLSQGPTVCSLGNQCPECCPPFNPLPSTTSRQSPRSSFLCVPPPPPSSQRVSLGLDRRPLQDLASLTLGPSVPGVPGRPRAPCRPCAPGEPRSPGKPRSPCGRDTGQQSGKSGGKDEMGGGGGSPRTQGRLPCWEAWAKLNGEKAGPGRPQHWMTGHSPWDQQDQGLQLHQEYPREQKRM